ncbi:hypothetical protein [Microbacterium sp. B19(2022)]|uniref:hypothetical protein n=1 Tax=Microbacterium sp. B19(2022) TaxID=2914045 RepID=UPI001F27ADAC|nr:hypothetical protein [Microbacterium sp. B19(2022)]
MTQAKKLLGLLGAAGLAVLLSGCSLNTMLWGDDGAGVIETTEGLIDAATEGEAESYMCEGHDPELREPADWEGLSAEEPERFVADYWPDQVPLEPRWNIGLSLPTERVAGGVEFPGYVFYQETDDGLCVVDVTWWTVESEG